MAGMTAINIVSPSIFKLIPYGYIVTSSDKCCHDPFGEFWQLSTISHLL